MNGTIRDATFLSIIQKLRKDTTLSAKPKMPDLTPAVGGGIGGAAILAYLSVNDPSEWVRLGGLVCSAVVLAVSAYCERGIRSDRNTTEQVRIQAANEPNVLVTDDFGAFEEDPEEA